MGREDTVKLILIDGAERLDARRHGSAGGAGEEAGDVQFFWTRVTSGPTSTIRTVE
jgi:hypothetical protein